MEFLLGPVPSDSVTLWVAYARNVLAQAVSGSGALPDLDPEVIEELESYLDAWAASAEDAEMLVWRGEADPERLEFLAHTFLRLVQRLAEQAESRGFPISPPEGDEFYQALISAIVTALEAHGQSSAMFSQQLRERWPGFKDT